MPETTVSIQDFISRWKASGASERSNYQLFLSELCSVIGVAHPEPSQPDNELNTYVFEKAVSERHANGSSSQRFIDLYKQGCFVLEAKQGAEKTRPDELDLTPKKLKTGHGTRGSAGWDVAMTKARHQAEGYAKALPVAEGWPPFILVVDVGHVIEVFADFSGTGKVYQQFPDAQNFRIYLDNLQKEETRERLKLIWTDPFSLDPARRSAAVTREVADRLATLAKSLEGGGHDPKTVAGFLMRCLFTMFAEDVGLLPKAAFTDLLAEIKVQPDIFKPMVESLWAAMDKGEFSTIIKKKVLRFNGGLFADRTALPLNDKQIALLALAAKADWKDVEPRIFGTLLERALDPKERHKLGAHFTPRAYVERLIEPTLLEPLREQWENAKAVALLHADRGDLKSATEQVKAFHRMLCDTKVLDPACGSGDFLYVALEHMKRLEGEVITLMEDFGVESRGLELTGLTVDPHQFLGIEINPRAAAIAEMVLWIGYLQWHFRTKGNVTPPEPVLKDFKNIECRDALLLWDRQEIATDKDGKPLSRWDGETMKTHPATGELVPDETARVPQLHYVNPRKADWPKADYVIGNPPFLGASHIRENLGDGYAEVLWETYPEVGQSVDYVMFWWHKAALLIREHALKRFGFITTNSIHQTFARRVLEPHLGAKEPLSIHFAIPDHPWVTNVDGAAVRIAMTIAREGEHPGTLAHVIKEIGDDGLARHVEISERKGRIHSNLRIGADVAGAVPLLSNERLASRGVQLMGSGFIVAPEEASKLGLGRIDGLERHIREYINGRDLNQRPRGVMVIDLFGLTEKEVRERYPDVYQHVHETVKPERDTNRRDSYRNNWWIHGEPRKAFRPALVGLPRYIATTETSKHRFFVFLDQSILPDNRLVNFALADAFHLGVLSSKVHVLWTLTQGGRLEDRPVYTKTACFDTFPFPNATDEQKARIRELAERLDAHRKKRQAEHEALTMTGMYNVLDKLRAGEELDAKERQIHEWAATTVLKDLHDELDAAVFDTYGWPADLSDEDILVRLVALNHERAEEEKNGLIRWLRPEYQNPTGGRAATQTEADFGDDDMPEIPKPAAMKIRPWPKSLPEQVQVVREVLAELPKAADETTIAKAFKGARKDKLVEILATLEIMGGAKRTDEGLWSG
jgi:hypothetical protein